MEALAQLRGVESGSILDPASLHGSRVQTARTARTSRPRVPEGVACSICAKKNVAGRRSVAKESFILEKEKASGCTRYSRNALRKMPLLVALGPKELSSRQCSLPTL